MLKSPVLPRFVVDFRGRFIVVHDSQSGGLVLYSRGDGSIPSVVSAIILWYESVNRPLLRFKVSRFKPVYDGGHRKSGVNVDS